IDYLDFTENAVPCELLLTGDKAFPVVVNCEGQVLIAASEYGKGHIMVAAHEAYLSSPHFVQFIDNGIAWLKPSMDSLIGIHRRFSLIENMLSEKGHKVQATFDFDRPFGVYYTHANDNTQSGELTKALKGGCGLLIGGQACYWATQNTDKNTLFDFPGNKVTSVAGIQFLGTSGAKSVISVTAGIPTSSLLPRHVCMEKHRTLYSTRKNSYGRIFPNSAVDVGLEVQVGCHTDDLSELGDLAQLERPPLVVQRYAVNNPTLRVSTIFGRLIYIIIPKGLKLGQVKITINGAVLASYFRHGETTDASWVDTICHYPAPWAEFETTNIIFTVPSDSVRSLKNPTIPSHLVCYQESPKNPSNPVPSQDILTTTSSPVSSLESNLHSGYPIMCKLDIQNIILDHNHMNMNGTWGITQELGHNQHLNQFEFPPHTNEALCNLWAVYVHEEVLKIPRQSAHMELKPQIREQRIKDYFQNGAQLDKWNEWYCLETYLQLQEAFGWEPFRRLFSQYQTMVVKNDNTFKMNLWAEMFSQEVQRNLAPFFKAWGWPIDEEITEKLFVLPEWEQNPMKEYMNSK
ncbi:TRPM8 channel-associated factor homolog, partial [Discoglossus pictus]